MATNATVKVELEGRGPLTLRPSDYKATGGEGSVYQVAGTSIKIYTDPHKMQRDGMVEKVKLLKPLGNSFIMAPQGVVKDTQGRAIGLYMPFAEGEPMPRVFTNAFRTRENFGDQHAVQLSARMHDTFKFAHSHKAIMVDPNEMNWIVDLTAKDGPEPRAIDVDSWAIGRFGASVVMPSIRDVHSKAFTELTDWFSWGVVTFQIFTGIHPYRGMLNGYKPVEMVRRMQDNASVFRKGVGLNLAVRDFNKIPGPLLGWYKATFEKGERVIPPSPLETGATVAAPATRVLRVVTTGSGGLVFEKIFEKVGDPVLRVWPCGVATTATGALFDLASKRQIGTLSSRNAEVVKIQGDWLLADRVQGALVYTFVDGRSLAPQNLPSVLKGNAFVRFENRLFVVTDTELVELNVIRAARPILGLGQRTAILSPKATKWFDGVGIQEAMGATFMVLPFGDKSCLTVRVRELDGLRPISAKAGNRFATVVALDKTGSYRKFEFIFAADYSTYSVWEGGTDHSELNISILPKGVCATITDDGELVIFVPRNGTINRINDKAIATDMALANWDDTVVYTQNGAVWTLKMK